MASQAAHHASGWAAGLVAAALVAQAGAAGPAHLFCIAAFAAGVAGGTAPDWLELAWWRRSRRRWITHRTVTHWGVAWLAAFVFAYRSLGHGHPWAAPLVGFACGGLVHLIADWPNPLGIPWIWKRHSLNWWNSGHCDLIIVAAAWAGALWLTQAAWGHATPLAHWLGWLRRV